jgi:predicted kinase
VPTVHALAGLPGAGKTTVAVDIARDTRAVRFSLDEWMLRLYGFDYEDQRYVERLEPCRALVREVATQVLAADVDVILDWNHWSVEKRSASASWAAQHAADFVVHFVTTPPQEARRRLSTRNSARDPHSHQIDPASLEHALTFFVPPSEAEGHRIVVHGAA